MSSEVPVGKDAATSSVAPEGVKTSSSLEEGQDEGKGFTIYSWNINGIRTLNMKKVIEDLNADILMVQETKISRNQLDSDTAFINDYTSYFSFCCNKSGYSGVATYCGKEFTPEDACECLMHDDMKLSKYLIPKGGGDWNNWKNLTSVDSEGRCVITVHIVETPDGNQVDLVVMNLYCPRLRCDPEDSVDNTEQKAFFHMLVLKRAEMFLKSGAFVLIAGDFNISHKALDHVEGVDGLRNGIFCEKMDELLRSGFHDTFRSLHPDRENAFTCWNSKTNARENNYGTRLDYILADKKLMPYLQSAEIHPDVMGSDHCPVSARFHSLTRVPSKTLPYFSTKWYAELSGRQTKIKDFFSKGSADINPGSTTFPFKQGLANLECTDKYLLLQQGPITKTELPGGKVRTSQLLVFTNKRPRLDSPSSVGTSNGSTKAKQSSMFDYMVMKPKIDSAPNISTATQAQDIPTTSANFNSCLPDSTTESSQTPKVKPNADFWKNLMKPRETPRCTGHQELCALKTVKKKGPTFGRQFWSCPRGVGSRADPNGNCGYFKWCS